MRTRATALLAAAVLLVGCDASAPSERAEPATDLRAPSTSGNSSGSGSSTSRSKPANSGSSTSGSADSGTTRTAPVARDDPSAFTAHVVSCELSGNQFVAEVEVANRTGRDRSFFIDVTANGSNGLKSGSGSKAVHVRDGEATRDVVRGFTNSSGGEIVGCSASGRAN